MLFLFGVLDIHRVMRLQLHPFLVRKESSGVGPRIIIVILLKLSVTMANPCHKAFSFSFLASALAFLAVAQQLEGGGDVMYAARL